MIVNTWIELWDDFPCFKQLGNSFFEVVFLSRCKERWKDTMCIHVKNTPLAISLMNWMLMKLLATLCTFLAVAGEILDHHENSFSWGSPIANIYGSLYERIFFTYVLVRFYLSFILSYVQISIYTNFCLLYI